MDMRLAIVYARYDEFVEIEADNMIPGLRNFDSQRKANIPEPDDTENCRSILGLLDQKVSMIRFSN